MGNDLTNAQVGKANSLIDASYRLSVQEQRIILAAISQVRRDRPVTDEVMYTIEAQALADLSGVALNDSYKEIKAAALRLKRREVRIEEEPNGDGQKPEVLVTGWVQAIKYLDAQSRVRLRFTRDILPYINQLSGCFTLYKLKNVAQMTSVHGIRLYEMIARWASTSNTFEIEIDQLKKAMQINDDYPRIFDLKKWVIQPAVDQINEHSDLTITWNQKKTGRRVTHLKFTFKQKKDTAKKQTKKITDAEISKIAKPGESWEQARARIGG